MEQWLRLSDRTNYDQYNRNSVDYHKQNVRALEPKYHNGIYSKLEENNRQVIDLGFSDISEKLNESIWMYVKV